MHDTSIKSLNDFFSKRRLCQTDSFGARPACQSDKTRHKNLNTKSDMATFIKNVIPALGLALLFLSHTNGTYTVSHSDRTTVRDKYSNPVIPVSVPDPTVIKASDGYYYIYGTEDTRNLPIYRSKDMINWEPHGTAFTDESRPKDVDGASLWAPEIRYIKGKYILLYSLAKWGQHWVSTIGYATADNPEGPFKPRGVVFSSKDVDVENSIDQYLYKEDGRYYMLWGSFFGLYIIELDVTNDLTITPKTETKQRIAGNAFEAVNLWKRSGYYYLFASVGSCCDGVKST